MAMIITADYLYNMVARITDIRSPLQGSRTMIPIKKVHKLGNNAPFFLIRH